MNNKIYDVAFSAIGGATIGVASFVGNMFRLGYIWDPILIPFLFLAFKHKRKTMPIWWPAISACVILSGYKFYLSFFIIGYSLIAAVIYKFGSKIRLSSIVAIAATYIIGYFGAWIFIAHIIHDVDVVNLVYQLTGARFSNPIILTVLLISEPMAFAFIYQYMFNIIERAKLFNE